MEMEKKNKKQKNSLSNTLYLFKIFGKEQPLLLVLKAVLIAFNIIIRLWLLSLNRNLNEQIVSRLSPLEQVLLIIINILLIRIVSRIINEVFIYIDEFLLMKNMSFKLMKLKLQKCMNLKIEAYDNPETFDKMKIADRMGSKVITSYCTSLFNIIASVAAIIPSAVILIGHSPIFAVFILLGSVPCFFINRLYNINEKFEKEIQTVNRRIDYYDNISGRGDFSKEIKLFGIQDYLINEYNRYYDVYTDKRYKADIEYQKRSLKLTPFISIAFNILPTLMLIYLASKGSIDAAGFIYVMGIFGMCSGAWRGVINFIYNHELSESRIKDFFDFLRLPLDLRKGEEIPSKWREKIPDIEFQNVLFSYPNSDGFMIKNLNLKIKSGEKLALIGLNGAGKSTFIKLLIGLYEPTEGKILFDGEDVSRYSQRSVYSLFSAVFQDYIKYELPLSETVSLGCEVRSDAEIRDALAAVEGENFLDEKFRDNFSAFVGKTVDENGVELSGGEHQKLVIARALLQNRPMLILDEPTSNLDAYAEAALIKNTLVAGGDKSAVFVSHRLSVSKFVDRILVMENGVIAEEGTHDELMARGGKYTEFYKVQAERF